MARSEQMKHTHLRRLLYVRRNTSAYMSRHHFQPAIYISFSCAVVASTGRETAVAVEAGREKEELRKERQ